MCVCVGGVVCVFRMLLDIDMKYSRYSTGNIDGELLDSPSIDCVIIVESRNGLSRHTNVQPMTAFHGSWLRIKVHFNDINVFFCVTFS